MDRTNRKTIIKAAAGAALVVAAGAGYFAWRAAGDSAPPTATAPVRTPIAATALVRLRTVDDVYAADAVIEAVRAATVSAQMAGNVTRFFVDAGDRVQRGQLLVRIDTRQADAQVAAGSAAVTQAQAQYAQARLNRDRTQQLIANGFISQAALDKADADLESARAALDMARAEATQATTARSFADVRAPIDGVVTRRLAELGELAAPGRPLLEIHDPTALRAVASIPQFVLPRIANVQGADVVLSASGSAGASILAATRVTVMPAADARLLSTQVRAELPAQLPPGVVPGTAAKVLLPVGTAQRLVVPADAVVRRGELTATYVVDAEGQQRLRQIRIGAPVDNQRFVEVLAGLNDGERVLIDPLHAANAGGLPLQADARR